MNGLEIEQLLSQVSRFLGTFSADTLPTSTPSSFSLVVNTDKHDKPGTHWQAIIVTEGIAHFFDSFGGKPKIASIAAFCERFNVIHFNRKRHQSFKESTCGAFCVYVINEMNRGRSFKSVMGTFERIKRDDVYVRKYLSKHFSFHF